MGKKKKLTKGQQRRIQKNQQKRLDKRLADPGNKWEDGSLGPIEHGRVVSRFGQHADVVDKHQDILRCNIRRDIKSLVTGDLVAWRRAASQDQGLQGIVEAVEARDSVLCRPDHYDGIKPVAANIDQIFIVSSPKPAFSDQIIDRYLVACEESGITPVIVYNKADLTPEDEKDYIQQRLNAYRNIGYTVYEVSATTGAGIDELRGHFTDKVSVLVGQSGVGKSSVIQAALPEVELAIGAISDNSGLGQHTTTVARWYPLDGGGALIDSPGIREFGLWHLEEDKIARGFIDFHPYLGTCKFRDCKHRNDPGCSLREAVEAGELDPQRLANFHRIIDSIEQS